MGFAFTSLAVKGGTRETVLQALALRGTNTYEDIPDSDITGAALPSGWYLIIANNVYPDLTEEAMLQRLSQATDVVTCFVEEHVMCSAASMWSNGRQLWTVTHTSEKGIENLETAGNLPSLFEPINTRLRAKQAAAGGKKAGVDHVFDIPVEMVEELTGYRHDRDMQELGDKAFEVLATTSSASHRSWFKKLLGG